MKGICTGCRKEKFIVNKTYNFCIDCNYYRLHNKTRFEAAKEKQTNKPKKVYKLKRTPLKPSKIPLKRTTIKSKKETKEKRRCVLDKDRETYFQVFKNKPNECEECKAILPDIFEDEDGNIIYISQYSHVLGKGAYPEFRHNPKNFNRLCYEHHQQWDFGDKEVMKIYTKNQKIIEELKKK